MKKIEKHVEGQYVLMNDICSLLMDGFETLNVKMLKLLPKEGKYKRTPSPTQTHALLSTCSPKTYTQWVICSLKTYTPPPQAKTKKHSQRKTVIALKSLRSGDIITQFLVLRLQLFPLTFLQKFFRTCSIILKLL